MSGPEISQYEESILGCFLGKIFFFQKNHFFFRAKIWVEFECKYTKKNKSENLGGANRSAGSDAPPQYSQQ